MNSGTNARRRALGAHAFAAYIRSHRHTRTELRMQNPQDTIDIGDPFAMLINPQAVLIAIEQSGRLGALNSRVCRPLDKPLIPKRDTEGQRTLDDIAGDNCESVGDTELGTIY